MTLVRRRLDVVTQQRITPQLVRLDEIDHPPFPMRRIEGFHVPRLGHRDRERAVDADAGAGVRQRLHARPRAADCRVVGQLRAVAGQDVDFVGDCVVSEVFGGEGVVDLALERLCHGNVVDCFWIAVVYRDDSLDEGI